MSETADVLVIGGGPVGGTLALGLAGSGLRVQVLEARVQPETGTDPRAIALSEGSRIILHRLGVWESLAPHATAIRTIHITQKKRFGRTVLRSEEMGRSELGYVVGFAELAASIEARLQAVGIDVLRGAQANSLQPGNDGCRVVYEQSGAEHAVEALLAVVADGGRSLDSVPGLSRNIREYGQSAVVAMVQAEQAHGGVAYERFTPNGPVALLPWGLRGFALVWTAAPGAAERLVALNEADFLQELHAHFGDRVGHFTSVSGRAAYPLKLARMQPNTAPHLAVIGNAAQTLHPVAGQGFNLGLRDAWELANVIRSHARLELGGEKMLAEYVATRRPDTGGGMFFTDFLVRTFSNDWPALGHIRGAALAALDLCNPVRQFVVRKMSLGAKG
jgi:2-octaprenyl-6-methoxyphenol hydroxylase